MYRAHTNQRNIIQFSKSSAMDPQSESHCESLCERLNNLLKLNRQVVDTDPDYVEIIHMVDVIELKLTGLINEMLTTKNTELIPRVTVFFRIIARSCRLGQHIQSHICRDQVRWLVALLDSYENTHFAEDEWDSVVDLAWKCLVNVLTQNVENQKSIWVVHREFLIKHISTRHRFVNISCATVYNIYINGIIDNDGGIILEHLLNILREEIADPNYTTTSEYVQYHLEYFICKEKKSVQMYRSLKVNDRLVLMHFVADFLRTTRDETLLLSTALILHFVKEFKLKSDCVLKTVPSFVDKICPSEVCALLEILAICSGSSDYHPIVSTDGSLFLNAGCLLQTINSLGQKTDNVFTPISKLAQIAPNSREGTNIERDISYELKSLLVRLIGNLAYRSPNNQTLAREMDIILAVLNCTSIDARNPLIKEWSILAIRNICEGNKENQAIVASLTKVGDADNSDILKEFNIEFGSMRIGESTTSAESEMNS